MSLNQTFLRTRTVSFHLHRHLASTGKLQKTFEKDDKKVGRFSKSIPIKELDIRYTLSSGPGGQNVNKTSTKVEVRLNVPTATWLSEDMKEALQMKLRNQLTKDGDLIIRSEKSRSQEANKEEAIDKLSQILYDNLEKPEEPKYTEEELEKIKKGKIRANKERLKEKRIRSMTKASRRSQDW